VPWWRWGCWSSRWRRPDPSPQRPVSPTPTTCRGISRRRSSRGSRRASARRSAAGACQGPACRIRQSSHPRRRVSRRRRDPGVEATPPSAPILLAVILGKCNSLCTLLQFFTIETSLSLCTLLQFLTLEMIPPRISTPTRTSKRHRSAYSSLARCMMCLSEFALPESWLLNNVRFYS
jgi:hypothetical protein